MGALTSSLVKTMVSPSIRAFAHFHWPSAPLMANEAGSVAEGLVALSPSQGGTATCSPLPWMKVSRMVAPST